MDVRQVLGCIHAKKSQGIKPRQVPTGVAAMASSPQILYQFQLKRQDFSLSLLAFRMAIAAMLLH
jgi:hypothetical protein